MFLNTSAGPGFAQWQTLNLFQAVSDQLVSAIFHHFGHVGISRSAVRWVVLDTAIFRWVMRRRDNDAISLCASRFVMLENRIGNSRRWRIAVILLHNDIHAVRCQYFQHGDDSGLGERVRVFTDVARASNAVLLTLFSNCLRNSQNMHFVEALASCAAAMAGGAKFHRMFRIAQLGLKDIILRC